MTKPCAGRFSVGAGKESCHQAAEPKASIYPKPMDEVWDKTLEQLDGQDWGEPNFPSYVVTTCHRLRRVPLRDFSVEDLRLVIGQQIGLEYLVPLALEHLERDPGVSGDYYEGDLWESVGRIRLEFWQQHPGLGRRWHGIQETAEDPRAV